MAGGPLTGISAGGLAAAGVVYQNAAATAQGSYLGFSGTLGLTVVNVSIDDFGTYAGDGIGDDWQVQYFGVDNPLAAPNADASHTGQTNLFKYIAGLNPIDPAALFAVGSVPVVNVPAARKVVFSPWFGDRTYVVEGSTNLISWTTVTGAVENDGTTRMVTDATAGLRKFYRVRITKP